ncbi:MAG: hypothetical protein MRZ30_00985, partial [Oscillospiraceae bacterium]|nr:hypothetical protein [Oscillospiraceae bacterium]
TFLCGYFYCTAIKVIILAVPLIGAHGRKNSLRFSAAILLLRNKSNYNGRAPYRGTWPKK